MRLWRISLALLLLFSSKPLLARPCSIRYRPRSVSRNPRMRDFDYKPFVPSIKGRGIHPPPWASYAISELELDMGDVLQVALQGNDQVAQSADVLHRKGSSTVGNAGICIDGINIVDGRMPNLCDTKFEDSRLSSMHFKSGESAVLRTGLHEAFSNKLVVAHHMVGNTYSYTQANWSLDIQLASGHGIDGFALNVGNDPWQPERVAAAFAAAAGSSFKLFLSFDMTSLPCSNPSHVDPLRKYIIKYADHPNQLKWDGKVVVSTFSGERCTFGRADVNSGWQSAIKDDMPPVHFIPSFFNAPSIIHPVVDGDFNWNGGWPMGNHGVNFESDNQHIAGNRGKTYMAAVSPWFFTHYGPTSWNKNWIYRGDEWLYNTRWEHLIENRDQVDIAQILTWNDYGESSYIGPIGVDQPNSQAWVDGFDHHGWLQMTTYYAIAFKTGKYPTIKQDALYAWSRTHPAKTTASHPTAPRPNNADWTEDYLWVVVFAVSQCQVTLTSGATSRHFDVSPGVTKLQLASSAGQQSAKIIRNNVDIVNLVADGFKFNSSPQTYNFNAFVVASAVV